MNTHLRMIKRMGYVRDQEGIMNRYLREKSHWDHHLSKTREFINASFADLTIHSVAVLGSGWLLDVPLEDMLERFETIYLVDIFFPPQIRKKVNPYKQVKCIEADLAGGAIQQVWKFVNERNNYTMDQVISEIKLQDPLSHLSPGAMISVNLINQLDILLCEFMERKGRFSNADLIPFRKLIQKFHLDCITRSPGCLVTDSVEMNTDRHGKKFKKSLVHVNLPEGLRSDHWIWEFDSHGTYLPESQTRMEVQAVEWS